MELVKIAGISIGAAALATLILGAALRGSVPFRRGNARLNSRQFPDPKSQNLGPTHTLNPTPPSSGVCVVAFCSNTLFITPVFFR
jgi:hypothetical protein